LGDGAYLGTEAVSSGAITLDDSPTDSHTGLGYTSTVKPSKLDIDGMGILLTKKITRGFLNFYETLGGKYGVDTSNMETITFRTGADELGSPPDIFTGTKQVTFDGGYEKEGNVIVQQEQPLPMTVRGLILDLGVYRE
jgi:hypothetical protein